MSNPNPNVWGEPSAWVNAEVFPAVGSGDTSIKAVKPKCTQFQAASPWYSRMSLGRGVQMGKITANQPIDNSICTNGQHPIISPFAHIGLFKNKQSSTSNIIPDSVYEETNQINWFFADVNAGSGGLRDHTINTTQANERWSPNADSTNNINYWTSPLVYYQIKSILLLIKVDAITGYNNNGFPIMQTYSLREWKTSHSDKKIARIWLQFYGYSQYTGDNLSYTTADTTSQADQCTTVCIMNSVNNIIDYATYNVDRSCRFYILHALQDNGYDTTTTYYSTAYNMFENQTYHSAYYQSTEGGWNLWSEIPYSDANYETILKMAALFGCPFTDTNTTIFDINFLSNDLFLPVIPENGIAEGEYTHGVRNVLNSLYDLDSVRDLNYDPDTPIKPYDPNTYSNTTGFNAISLGASMTMRYVLNSANIDKLADDLWTICAALAVDSGEIDYTYFEDKVIDNFLVTSPIESIISLKRFPFNVPYISPQEKSAVKLGKNTGSAEGYLTNFVFNTIVFSGVDIYPRFGNSFLDYEPYTSYEVYIPFCGTVKIRAADILGHTLNVTLQIDLSTGTCTAFIMADSLVIETVTGACGVDLQVTGTDTTAVNSAIVSSITRARNAKTQEKEVISSTFTPTGLFSAILNPIGKAHQYSMAEENLTQASYELSHISVPMHSMSAASPLLGWIQEFDARIMIYYPEGSVIDNNAPPTAPSLNAAALAEFGSLKGFATVSPGIASEFHGYTQGTIIPDNIPCTESERNRIKQAFSAGVFLP